VWQKPLLLFLQTLLTQPQSHVSDINFLWALLAWTGGFTTDIIQQLQRQPTIDQCCVVLHNWIVNQPCPSTWLGHTVASAVGPVIHVEHFAPSGPGDEPMLSDIFRLLCNGTFLDYVSTVLERLGRILPLDELMDLTLRLCQCGPGCSVRVVSQLQIDSGYELLKQMIAQVLKLHHPTTLLWTGQFTHMAKQRCANHSIDWLVARLGGDDTAVRLAQTVPVPLCFILASGNAQWITKLLETQIPQADILTRIQCCASVRALTQTHGLSREFLVMIVSVLVSWLPNQARFFNKDSSPVLLSSLANAALANMPTTVFDNWMTDFTETLHHIMQYPHTFVPHLARELMSMGGCLVPFPVRVNIANTGIDSTTTICHNDALLQWIFECLVEPHEHAALPYETWLMLLMQHPRVAKDLLYPGAKTTQDSCHRVCIHQSALPHLAAIIGSLRKPTEPANNDNPIDIEIVVALKNRLKYVDEETQSQCLQLLNQTSSSSTTIS
jgi:hypothetical protein